MDEQDQDSFDLLDDFIKTEPGIGTSQTIQNNCLRKPKTFKFEDGYVYQTTEQFAPVEIKKEIIKCEMPKIEGCSTEIEQDTVSEYVEMFPKTIKKEFENISDVEVTYIKQEVDVYVQTKTESVVQELLTSECDLQTLKIESTDYYIDKSLRHPYNQNKLINIISKKKRYECPICQNNFPSSKSRSTHIDGHFKKSYAVCLFCGRLMTKIEFFLHYFIHVVKYRMKNIVEKPLKCKLSFKKFKRKCDTGFKTCNLKNKLRKHLIVHNGEKPLKCDICLKCFNFKSTLQRHLMIHKGEKPFKCDICFKSFKFKYSVQRHLIIHTSKKPFKCDICSKCFNFKSTLQKHLITHSGEKPFKCDICSKCFNHKSNLRKHLLSHSSEKPFKCNICDKGFTQKQNLHQHLIIHTCEKPFKCDICSKCFNNKANLQRHLINHSCVKLFKCDVCFKSFTYKSLMQKHLIIHSGEKPFKCDICNKYFNFKSNLQTHLLIHSGEKPFKCDNCSYRFNQKSSLQRHLIIHTKKTG